MREVGNRNLVAIVFCVIILVAVLANQESYLALNKELDYGSDTQSSVTYGVYGYRDGEFISIPIEDVLLSPFRIGEEEFEEIAPRVDWTSTGEAIDWSTFTLTGSMKISFLNEYWKDAPQHPDGGYWDTEWIEFTNIDFSSTVASDSWFQSFVLGTDLCTSGHFIEDRKTGTHVGEDGWQYAFSGSVTGTVYDEFGGGPLMDTASFGGLGIWITYVATYGITATIT